MDQEIRKYLIDQCRLGRTIYYEDVARKLKLDVSLSEDREILSETLGDISTFEYEHGRPLVSSAAIYKIENDHGNGFYSLCERLGIGKASKLKDELFGFRAFEQAKEFWENETNYRQFYDLKMPVYPVYDEIEDPFFNKEEIEFLCKWADKVYDSTNPDHVSSKNYLLETVWRKTKFWSNEVIKRLEQYETSNRRAWSKLGKDNGNTVSVFKPYTWARIYKYGNKNKDIFFTIGVDVSTKALIYKLDYYYESDSHLTPEQKELCAKHIPEHLRWNPIPSEKLSEYNWESLINLTVEFIAGNSHHYDQLLELVWGEGTFDNIFNNNITLREFPKSGLSELPKIEPKFMGTNTDFIQKSKEDKELGDSGEELVRDNEINKLQQQGLHSLANRVRIVEDGNGYDVLSFDSNGSEIYIEVKTTRGNENTPFFLSLNEKLFYERNAGRYMIYRLYNYEGDKNYADFFIVKDLEADLLLQPTEFKAYIRNK